MSHSGLIFRSCRAINPPNKRSARRRPRQRALPYHRDFAQMGRPHPGRPRGSPAGSTRRAPWPSAPCFSGSRPTGERPGSCDSLGQQRFSPKKLNSSYEIETAEPLLFILRRFLQQLTLRLGAVYLVAREMTLRLTFADPPAVRRDGVAEANKSQYEHCFHIPDPTNSVEILFRLLQTHLETFRAEHPIVAVSLKAEASRPGRQQFHLFETPLRDPNQLHETLTRLTGLLGKERVGRPLLEDTHRPDAFHLVAFSWQLPSSSDEFAPMMGPALRRCRAGFSPAPSSAVIARQGPYRTSGDWWDVKKWERTEWDMQLADGGVCRCREEGEGWEVEGIYD